MSKFIVIEGPDRVGKATQAKLLKEFLESQGKSVLAVEVPLRSNFIYHIIYWMLGNGLAKKLPKHFQWMQYFNRQIFQWTKLPKLEKEYDYIVMDRWSLSTSIYGAATKLPENFTKDLYDRLRDPDYTFVLLGPAHKHEAEDVYEADSELQKTVRELYAEWTEQHPGKSLKIDCRLPKESISGTIVSTLKEFDLL